MSLDPTGEIRCPHCGSPNSEMMTLFGRQLLTAQYYCRDCRTPFERIKGEDVLQQAERHPHKGIHFDED